MKKLILLLVLLILNGVIIYSQINQEPQYYLNSQQFDISKIFLNLSRIDSINVKKNTKDGEVFVFTKNREFTFFRLSDILKKYTNIGNNNDSILFKISGKIIEDTTSIKIDDTYFVYVETEKLTNVKYLSSKFLNLTIVNIDLERTKRAPKIYIKGDRDILDKFENK